MHRQGARGVVAFVAFAVLVTAPSPAWGTFPGANGRLVVGRIQNDGWSLVTMDPDGGNAATIMRLPGSRNALDDADWSRDGRWIAVNPCCGRDIVELVITRFDGSRTREVLDLAESPSWAPNGERLAVGIFARLSPGVFTSRILIVSADGSRMTRFAGGRLFRAFDPAWSPDGSRIAFFRDRGGSGEIAIKPVDGGATVVVPLPARVEWAEQLEWAPDGTALTFIAETCFGDCGDVWRVDADGSDVVALTKTPTAVETDAVWAPDGTTIAFIRWPDPGFETSDVWFMAPDGSGKTPLTTARMEFFVDWASA